MTRSFAAAQDDGGGGMPVSAGIFLEKGHAGIAPPALSGAAFVQFDPQRQHLKWAHVEPDRVAVPDEANR